MTHHHRRHGARAAGEPGGASGRTCEAMLAASRAEDGCIDLFLRRGRRRPGPDPGLRGLARPGGARRPLHRRRTWPPGAPPGAEFGVSDRRLCRCTRSPPNAALGLRTFRMTDLLLLPGDGIGPGSDRAGAPRGRQALTPDLTLDERPFGGTSYDQHGTPLTDETLAAAKAAKAVLMGAVGGPQWAGRAARQAAGGGPAEPARRHGRVRQPAPGALLPAAGRRLQPEARGGRGPRLHDRPRADRRHLFRPARGSSRTCRAAASAPSTPRSTPPPRSSGSPAWPSSWPAAGATR